MKSYLYKTKQNAEEASKELGCKGCHRRKKAYMPCKTYGEFKEAVKRNRPPSEIDELVDFDGNLLNSKIPIIDPKVTAKGMDTMDKTVAMTRITQDPLMRGYRTYYGESVKGKPVNEEDMSDAYGYEETKDMDAEETVDFFIKELGFDQEDAESRASEMGKDEKLDNQSDYNNSKGFVMKGRLVEKKKIITKEEIMKMAEDSLVPKSEDKEIKIKKEVSPILKRNIKALKNQASANGITSSELSKMISNE